MIAVLASVGVLGCGGDKSPQEQCEDLLSVVCGRAVKCILGAAGREDECFDALQRVAGCQRVRQESPSYDTCVDRVESQSCPDLFQNSTPTKITVFLPAECSGVVDLMQSSADDRAELALSSVPGEPPPSDHPGTGPNGPLDPRQCLGRRSHPGRSHVYFPASDVVLEGEPSCRDTSILLQRHAYDVERRSASTSYP
jgi:hypothetical protein